MSDMAGAKLVVLWEHEIRLAARLIALAHAAIDKGDDTEEDKIANGQLIVDAFNACAVALFGADDQDVTLALSSVPDLAKARRQAKAKKKDAS